MDFDIKKDYISLDEIFLEFSENIDYIPLLLSQNEIEIEEIECKDYIKVCDYKKIKNCIYLKRNAKEITINKNNNLIEYNLTEFNK